MTMLEVVRQTRFVSMGLALSLGITACIGGDAPITQATPKTQTCVNPSGAELLAVRSLLAETRTDISDYPTGYYQRVAEQFGLTVVPTLPREDNIFADSAKGAGPATQLPFSSYFNTAQQRLDLYGVDLKIAGTADKSTGSKPINISKLERPAAKWNMVYLIRAVQDLPIELFKYAGLKQVAIADLPPQVGGLVLNREKDRFYIDPFEAQNNDTFLHELYHLIDKKECGNQGMFEDKVFRSLSPADLYRKPDMYATYQQDIVDAAVCSERYIARYTEPEKFRKINRRFKAVGKRVVAFNDYGATKIAEDKATLGSQLLSPKSYDVFTNNNFPVMDKKFSFLLARLYRDAPRLAKFLIYSSQVSGNQC